MLEAVDGFVLVLVCGLVTLHVLPESVAHAGPMVLIPALVGLIVPGMAERTLFAGSSHARVHRWIISAGLFALALHAMLDGVALEAGSHGHGHDHGAPAGSEMLALGVVMHRLPLGIAVWWSVRPRWGEARAWALLAIVIAATLVGYFAGHDALPMDALAHVQAFVAGSLLHVMVHHTSAHLSGAHDHADCDHHDHHHLHVDEDCAPDDHGHHHDHDHHHHHHHHEAQNEGRGWDGDRIAAGVGGLCALGLLYALTGHDHLRATGHLELDAWPTFVTLLRESAPALVLAFVGAGVLRALLAPSKTAWLSRGGRTQQALRGMGFGLPLPICSCGVLPLYDTLVRAGVPTAAAVAFLIATPELGLDAVLISLPLLGGKLTVARVVAAAVVALLVGVVASRWMRSHTVSAASDAEDRPREPLRKRLIDGLRFGLGDLFDDTAPWLVLGLGVAALIEPLLSADFFAGLPPGMDVVAATLLGLPGYVCAVGATPIAAVLMHKGLSAGAALAFLLTGPATNITTFGVLARLHGKRGAVAFAVATASAAILAGLAVNLALPDPGPIALHDAHDQGATALEIAALAALALLAVGSLLRLGPRGIIAELLGSLSGPHVH